MKDCYCIPKSYEQWLLIKELARQCGHEVTWNHCKDIYNVYPNIRWAGMVVGTSSTEGDRVSVDNFIAMLKGETMDTITPMTYCQSHTFGDK